MSDDEGVTPFQEGVHPSRVAVTPARGKGALGAWRFQDGSRTLRRDRPILEAGTRLWVNQRQRGVCAPALKFRYEWEGLQRKAKVRTGLGKTHRPGS